MIYNDDESLANVAMQVEEFIKDYEKAPKDMKGNLSALKMIPNFLSKKECEFFRKLVSPQSNERIQMLSNRKRLIFNSECVADWFWNRLKLHNPFKDVTDEHGDDWRAVGINPRFRLIRYDEGEQFKTHEDGFYWESWNRKTFATAMAYLNDMHQPEDGGATRFHALRTTVEPAEGLLILFLVDNIDHCGEPCKKQKYLLRTDVFYELVQTEPIDKFQERRKEIFKHFERYND